MKIEYKSLYLPVYHILQNINSEIATRKSQIQKHEKRKKSLKLQMENIISLIDIQKNFTKEQWLYLSKFIREETLSDSNYVVTDAMSKEEELEMKREMAARRRRQRAAREARERTAAGQNGGGRKSGDSPGAQRQNPGRRSGTDPEGARRQGAGQRRTRAGQEETGRERACECACTCAHTCTHTNARMCKCTLLSNH